MCRFLTKFYSWCRLLHGGVPSFMQYILGSPENEKCDVRQMWHDLLPQLKSEETHWNHTHNPQGWWNYAKFIYMWIINLEKIWFTLFWGTIQPSFFQSVCPSTIRHISTFAKHCSHSSQYFFFFLFFFFVCLLSLS